MTLKDWADLSQLTLIPAILLSLLGLWFNLNDNRKRAVDRRNAEWQKVVIYSMLDSKPLTLSEIRQELVTQATAFGLTELGLERIRDISIRAAVLDLIACKAVVRLDSKNPKFPDTYSATRSRFIEPAEQFKAMQEARMALARQVDSVRAVIEQNTGRFNAGELGQFIRQSTKIDDSVANDLSSILTSLEVQGLIGRDDNQKLVRIWRERARRNESEHAGIVFHAPHEDHPDAQTS